MDKHVLSCERVCIGSQIIIQELFDERGTEQGEKGDNLDHIINFTTRCTPLCDRHIPTTQEMPKQTPHFIFSRDREHSISLASDASLYRCYAQHSFLVTMQSFGWMFFNCNQFYLEFCLNAMIEFLMFNDNLLGQF